jgi:nucleoporin SEH1
LLFILFCFEKINPGLNKVAWAHPEFGSLIAVACDRLVWVYEETCFNAGKSAQSGWIKRAKLTDAHAPITDLKFAPKNLGLQLIVCSQNGEVRIYECSDILNSSTWALSHSEFKTNFNSCSSCSWSTCFNLPTLLAIGSDESSPNTDKLAIFEYNEGNRTSKIERPQAFVCTEPIHSLAFAPSIGKLYHVLAIASKSLLVSTIKPPTYEYYFSILDFQVDLRN